MKKTNRRFLAYAVALAASFAAVPGGAQAAPGETPSAETAVDTGTAQNVAAATTAEADTKTANTAVAEPVAAAPAASGSETTAA